MSPHGDDPGTRIERYDTSSGSELPLSGPGLRLLTRHRRDGSIVLIQPTEPSFLVCQPDGRQCETQPIPLPPLRDPESQLPHGALVSEDGELVVLNPPTYEFVVVPTRPGKRVVHLGAIPPPDAFSPDGKLLIGEGGRRAWRTSDGAPIRDGGRPARVQAAVPRAFSSGGSTLRSSLGRLDLRTGHFEPDALDMWRDRANEGRSCERGYWEARLVDGKLGMFYGPDKASRVFRLAVSLDTPEPIVLDVRADGSEVLLTSRQGSDKAGNSFSRTILLWSRAAGMKKTTGRAAAALFGMKGSLILIEPPHTIRAVDEGDQHELWRTQVGGRPLEPVEKVWASEDERTIAFGFQDFHLLDTMSGRTLQTFPMGARGVFSRDGRLLAVSTQDHFTELWAGPPWTLRARLVQFDGAGPVLLSADGHFELLGETGDEHSGLRCTEGTRPVPFDHCRHLLARDLWTQVLSGIAAP